MSFRFGRDLGDASRPREEREELREEEEPGMSIGVVLDERRRSRGGTLERPRRGEGRRSLGNSAVRDRGLTVAAMVQDYGVAKEVLSKAVKIFVKKTAGGADLSLKAGRVGTRCDGRWCAQSVLANATKGGGEGPGDGQGS